MEKGVKAVGMSEMTKPITVGLFFWRAVPWCLGCGGRGGDLVGNVFSSGNGCRYFQSSLTLRGGSDGLAMCSGYRSRIAAISRAPLSMAGIELTSPIELAKCTARSMKDPA
jgi:hypothetical protein